MEKFRKQHREKFMSDWMSCASGLTVYRSMWLMKRNGPILTGIYLRENRANTSYFVIPHIHNLTRETSAVTLTLKSPIRNERNTYDQDFTLKSHDREFPEACKRLRNQFFVPLAEELSLSEVVAAYERYISQKNLPDVPNLLFEDVISLFAWSGDIGEAERRLQTYISVMSKYDEWIFRNDGGKTAYFQKLEDIAKGKTKLHEIYAKQVELLKVGNLRDNGLLLSGDCE